MGVRLNLTFHGLGLPDHPVEPGERPMWVESGLFETVLDMAKERDHVRVMFDDGNATDASVALPALAERGLSAGFFVVAERIDQPHYLSTRQLRELSAAGMEVGSHGMAHRAWRGLSGGELEREIVEAKDRIEQALGEGVHSAACPFGSYDRRVLSALRSAGFRTVFTSDRWVAEAGEFLQPRYSVRADDTPESVRALMDGRPGVTARLLAACRLLVKRWR